MKAHRLNRGFTLMELMIVMVIMSILATIVIGNFGTSTRRGRDNRRKSDLKNISTALETYYNDKGEYPSSLNGVMIGCGASDAQTCAWGSAMADQNSTLYMAVIPADPVSSQKYYYASNTQSYVLYARLENTLDEGTGVNQTGYNDKFSGGQTNCSSAGSALCTYAVSSSDITP